MLPPGLATALTSLMVNCLAVATTFDASASVADKYAAVVGDDPSMTHTSSPPTRALPSLSVCRPGSRSSRGHMLPINFPGADGRYLEQRRCLVARIQHQHTIGRSGRQLWKTGPERPLAAVE